MKTFSLRNLLSLGSLLGASLALLPAIESPAAAYNGCAGSDCIGYDLSTQDSCNEVTESASSEARWVRGLSRDVDQAIKGGRIVAYKIQWFNGNWSGWFVPGINDIDTKFNSGPNTLRRMWSYFYDHNHSYVICTKVPGGY